MLTHLQLKSTSSADQPHLGFTLKPSITIFVGPNNSGKSLLLREIQSYCTTGRSSSLILDSVSFRAVDHATAAADLQRIKRSHTPGETLQPEHIPVRIGFSDMQVYEKHYHSGRTNPDAYPNFFAAYHLEPLTVTLDAQARTTLLEPQGFGNIGNPSNPVAKLFRDDPKRMTWRSTIHSALGIYPSITALTQGKLSVSFGTTPPPNERTMLEDIIQWVNSARTIQAVSDGVKAFTGILLQLYGGDPKVIIVDEPEAFLHPSIAKRLGKELATAARTEGKYVFAATHSADFLMGAIQSGAVVNIVRLTHTGGVATARLLPNKELIRLMSDPMLRSVGVLSGLFFDNVIVTEADADRAFYQEVNERLLSANDRRGISHALFLNADNHQTIPSIIAPLRQLGIPAAGIPDLDVVKRGGSEWTRQLNACCVPQGQHASLQLQRKTVLDTLIAAAPSDTAEPENYFKTKGGVALLESPDRAVADSLFDELDRYGLFVVRCGEVEAWLNRLGVPRNKKGWRSAIFTAMGSDPAAVGYVKPDVGDVWDFIGVLGSWLSDPQRRGIPK